MKKILLRGVAASLLLGLAAGAGVLLFRNWPLARESPALREIRSLESAGKFAAALQTAEKALQSSPSSPNLLAAAGRLRILVGDFEIGKERFHALAAGAMRPAEVHVTLARLLEEAWLLSDAGNEAGKALQIEPGIAGARAIVARYQLASDRYEEARDLLAPFVRAGSADGEELLTYGQALLRLGEYRDAEGILRRALARTASRPEGRLALGEALNGCGEHQKAADLMAEILEEDPSSGKAYFILGTALARLGRRDAARSMMKSFEDLGRFDHLSTKSKEIDRAGLRNRALYERSTVLADTGRYRLSLDACRRAAALKPDDGPVLLAVAHQLAGNEATAECFGVLDEAIARGVEPLGELLSFRGALLLEAGLIEEARRSLDRALSLSQIPPGALIARGRIALETDGLPEEAEKLFLQARTLSPQGWEPACWLGRAAEKKGDLVQAESLLFEAERLGEGSRAEPLRALGFLALRLGKNEPAAKLLLESLKIDPISAEAYRGLEETLRVLNDPGRAGVAGARRKAVEEIEGLIRKLRAGRDPWEKRGSAFLEIASRLQSVNLGRDALKYLQLAREAAPDLIAAHRSLAKIADSPEQSFIKAQALACVLRLDPKDPVAPRDLALILARLTVRLDRALELAQRSLAAEDSPEGHYALGEVLLARGDGAGASREAQLAVQKSPGERKYQDLAARAAGKADARSDAPPEEKR